MADLESLAAQAAHQVLGELWVADKYPVDVEWILDHRGIEVVRGRFDRKLHGGLSKVVGKSPRALINISNSSEKQLFTLARLLGNYEYQKLSEPEAPPAAYSFVDARVRETSDEDQFCDLFAMELLMPAGAVAAAKHDGMGERRMLKLFHVEPHVFNARLKQLSKGAKSTLGATISSGENSTIFSSISDSIRSRGVNKAVSSIPTSTDFTRAAHS